MPSPTGKGKIPLSEVCAYDPNTTPAADGKPRIKVQKKKTSASMVKGSKHVQS